ncbi:Fpg/Nei family DNA glycosylase [Corynebacterium sp. TAE3-ERU12]|uniref:DNA-formamidopyrimidine glycosylase family protein n=1 Tax=Corynebacterium sp. TAE3-ERU12 TaxID=2849491 RepID=UPI001C439BEB|nr:DNA-formamidopyrimidine glycosylase family protein [Corynebacterium sp. TAE3-ERU12]MBV7295922.1 Fpg/Nei family DNA glycosylase [Corynebacterium sp. TAE3-ERU12]
MPEGDTVHQLSSRLQFMVGREVLSCSLRVPRYATVNLAGSRCTRVWALGKHLFMLCGQNVLHTHLKMEGSWAVHDKGTRWRKPGHTARVVLTLSAPERAHPIEVVGHNLGLVRVFPLSQFGQQMGYLGPDVLAPEWPEAGRPVARQRLMAKPDRPVGTALVDQSNLAGVGNEYRAEICFLAGVHPATAVAECNIDQILDLTRKVMWANRNARQRVFTGVNRPGQTTYVFGRNHRPCRRCGTQIRKGALGGVDQGGSTDELERIIWWCPSCQPGPEA